MSTRKKLVWTITIIMLLTCIGISYGVIVYLPKFDEAFARIETNEKVVALTFDDGPSDPYSEQILQVLEKNNVKATFFMIGRNIEEHKAIAQQIVNSGHQVGNHTYSHPRMILKTKGFIAKQIEKTDSILLTLGVPENNDFRPPYGQHMFHVHSYLEAQQRNNVLFDVIVGDWSETDGQVIADRVLSKFQNGSIICLHDGGGNRQATVKATEILISELHKKGYKFVTIKELLTYR